MKLSSVSHSRNSTDSWISLAVKRPPGLAGDLDHALDPVDHRQEVPHRELQVAEHPLDVHHQVFGGTLVERAIGLEVHDRLAPFGTPRGRDPDDPAVRTALDPDHRVHHDPHLQAVGVQLGADGVHQERRVLDVHVDDGARRLVAVGLEPRAIAAHGQHPGGAGVHELEHPSHLGRQFGRFQILGQHRGRAPHVHAHELGQRTGAGGVELFQQAVSKQRAIVLGLGDRDGLRRAAHKR